MTEKPGTNPLLHETYYQHEAAHASAKKTSRLSEVVPLPCPLLPDLGNRLEILGFEFSRLPVRAMPRADIPLKPI
jgi:hypothetical protein